MLNRRPVALALIAIVIPGCAGPEAPTPTAEPTRDRGYITSAEYGDEWPFTRASGTLRCYDDPLDDHIYVTFDTGDGIEYALNGSARDFGFPELDETIMPDVPDRSKTLPLIERGLELCE